MKFQPPTTGVAERIAPDDETLLLRSSLGKLLRDAARRWPDREAVVYSTQPDVDAVRWTFGELDAQATDLAAGLCAAGYQPGEHIAVWAPNYPEWILLEWAAARAGLVLVALNPLYRAAELAFALRVTATVAIFVVDELKGMRPAELVATVREQVPSLRDVYQLRSDLPALARRGGAVELSCRTVDPTQPMMVQFTSGTTGVPKAAQLTHQGLATTGRDLLRRLGVQPGDRIAHGFPLFHVGGSGVLTPATASVGYTTLPLVIFEAGRALDLLESERCTGFFGVPTMLLAMLEHPSLPERDLSSLRLIVVGGAVLPVDLVRKVEQAFGVGVLNVYGQTECSGVMASALATDSAELKAESVGVPLPGVSVKIVDTEGAVVACGVAGELLYRGPGAMAGYLNPESSDTDSAPVGSDSWLATGDIASMDDSGYLRISGRVKEMVIRGGENLSPAEIEGVLLGHPDIAEVAVVGVPDRYYGEELCAVVRTVSGADVDQDSVRQWCSDRVSRWKVPRYVVTVHEFPMTPAGKIRKFLVAEQMAVQLGLDTVVNG
ncbi:AMP-binding protein [Mycolicibacterium sphagni]|uniref:Long-chain-fatty-acid--CoA ligase FadD13 n=1 Tax=Mycolicibacterium sphagni TaxID=1786 RepID=A0A255D9Y8_9MYCO|nr:AMP-binding protein [Mycolicibacterium sphagni]OYN76239.1 hypothetical protein CG716_22735 [Mycolicibacterium sphagni]